MKGKQKEQDRAVEAAQELKAMVKKAATTAPDFAIISNAGELAQVQEYRKRVVAYRKRITAKLEPMKAAAHAAWKGLCALLNEVDAEPKAMQAAAESMIGDWNRREAKRVREEQRQRDEEARKAEAAKARVDGDAKLAKAIETGKVAVVAPAPVAPAQMAAGTIQTTRYTAEVTDLMALVKAIAAGMAPVEWVSANETALNALARATKGTAMVPGVTFRKIEGTSFRG